MRKRPYPTQKRTFLEERAALSFFFENNRYGCGKGLTLMVCVDYWAGSQVEMLGTPNAGQAPQDPGVGTETFLNFNSGTLTPP